MTRGVRLYLVGSFVLVSLAGCGRGFFQSAEREPWRAEAEIACLKSGAVKESPELVRIEPISGPGMCGAEFPLKVAALGEGSGSFGLPMRSAAARRTSATSRAGRSSRSATAIRLPQRRYPDSALRQPGLRRAAQRADFADRAGRRPAGRRNRPAARGHAALRDAARYMDAPAYPPRDRYPRALLAPIRRHRTPAAACRGSVPRRAIPSARSVRSR